MEDLDDARLQLVCCAEPEIRLDDVPLDDARTAYELRILRDEGVEARAGQRRVFGLHEAHRLGERRAREHTRQQLAAEEAGESGEQDRVHENLSVARECAA